MQNFQVFVRNVYGCPKVYPAGQVAQQFADLLQVKTFSHRQLQQIEAMGYVVAQVADPASLLRVAS